MATAEHLCPAGLRARALLKARGFEVDDDELRSRSEVDAFKARFGVATTPQIFIEGQRIGGLADLENHLGAAAKVGELSYRPVLVLFALAVALSLGLQWRQALPLWSADTLLDFVAFSMCLLGVQKLRDLRGFVSQFLTYDLVARRSLRYAVAYPFLETGVGLLMLLRIAPAVTGAVALVLGTIGTLSVVQAVYVEKRALRCACVGGNSNVPLGPVSLAENLIMTATALWMLLGSATAVSSLS
ncbi:MAG: glutaredoxin [Pseudomonadota bacterium]